VRRLRRGHRHGSPADPGWTLGSWSSNPRHAGYEASASAALGLGLVQPPAYYVTGHLASGALVPVLARFPPTPWSLYLCYPRARHLPHRVRAFIDFALAALAAADLA
jgi:DNA-binding transcriptional LysR family regulator